MDAVERDPLHHKGAIISYSIGTAVILFLLVLHIIATAKSLIKTKKAVKNKSPVQRKKTYLLHLLPSVSCGLSILCYFIISISALLAECHFPSCFCDKLPRIIPTLYVIGKGINYYFFLVKAKAAQGMMNIFPEKLCGITFPSKDAIFNIWFPLMLFNTAVIYVFVFNIGPPIFSLWTGVCVQTELSHLGCQYIMSDDFLLLSNLGPILDVTLCVLFTYLFYVPIIRVTHLSWDEVIKKDKKNADVESKTAQQTKEKFISVLRVSLILALINIFSSTIVLTVLPHFPELWWLFSYDYAVNAVCTFLMMGNDRRLFMQLFRCKLVFYKKTKDLTETSQSDGDGLSKSSTKKGRPSMRSQDTIDVMAHIELENKKDGATNLINELGSMSDNDKAHELVYSSDAEQYISDNDK